MENIQDWFHKICNGVEWEKLMVIQKEYFEEIDTLRAEILSGNISEENQNEKINRISELMEDLKKMHDDYNSRTVSPIS